MESEDCCLPGYKSCSTAEVYQLFTGSFCLNHKILLIYHYTSTRLHSISSQRHVLIVTAMKPQTPRPVIYIPEFPIMW